MNKHKLRSKILKIRKKNSNKNLEIDLNKFFSFLKINELKFKNIGGYFPSNFEIDDLKILEMMEKKNFNVSLPVIKKNYQMNFLKWSRNDPLKVNKFGILEPLSAKIIIPDILLIPLVSFDSELNRLGYGGGYYDRYIEKIERIKKVIKIGLAFSNQKIKKVPTNKFDKKLDIIITEKEILQ